MLPDLIDIEASGLHFDAYPIEVGIGVRGMVHAWLIKPEPSWVYWDSAAEALHGISREKLMHHGLPARDVAAQIDKVMESSRGLLYSEAAPWDEDWINILFRAAGVARNFHILPLQDSLTAEQLRVFDLEKKELAEGGRYIRHRAVADVKLAWAAWGHVFSLG